MPGADATYRVIVIGGGHAGVEAAWAAANLLPEPRSVALITLDPAKIGVMSCNPAIGGLAKGQLVREVDALGGLMGLAADATGIQFKVLNASKGAAVHGPRCQSDKLAYAAFVRRAVRDRPEIEIVAGSVDAFDVCAGRARGAVVRSGTEVRLLAADALVLTTGTFMRGLMHTGESRREGGRHGEGAAGALSSHLRELGFELGRLKTGTPPRVLRGSIDWDVLPPAHGDSRPTPFSELTEERAFPVLPQVACAQTATTGEMHALIRDNLHLAAMYSGAITSPGPRYCPSIEDKVVRFADRESHGVFLEPESLESDWIYCNGISTSLPAEIQDRLVRAMPGCERAEICQHGYAVEYDMVRPHQILATGMTKGVEGLFLAGQINGTSGYEEAGAQGVVAGVNAARLVRGESEWVLGRDQAYIGVLMDDLVTKTPVEPYRMFTSRAEHRLLLRSDNAPDRLTSVAIEIGLLEHTAPGRRRRELFARRVKALECGRQEMERRCSSGEPELGRLVDQDRLSSEQLGDALASRSGAAVPRAVAITLHAERRYSGYIRKQEAEVRRHAQLERRPLPEWLDYRAMPSLRNEARDALARFRPATFGQASRLEGITPSDLTLLAVLVERAGRVATA